MKQDPKYQFGDNDKLYHRDGKYWIPSDEPVIVFRGKDIGTIVAILAYEEFMQHIADTSTDQKITQIAKDHLSTIKERRITIQKFIDTNPERIGLGCHTCKPGEKPKKIHQFQNSNHTI